MAKCASYEKHVYASQLKILWITIRILTLKPLNARKLAFNACLCNNSHSGISVDTRKISLLPFYSPEKSG